MSSPLIQKIIDRLDNPPRYDAIDYIEHIQQEEWWKSLVALNDAGHRNEHFEEVFYTGLLMRQTLLDMHVDDRSQALIAKVDDLVIAQCAYMHDIFSWNRQYHHTLAADFYYNTRDAVNQGFVKQRFGDVTDHNKMVSRGISMHRASGDLYDIYSGNDLKAVNEGHAVSVIMNAADKGIPDYDEYLRRALAYRGVTTDTPGSEDMAGALIHLRKKFGAGGYAKVFPCYKISFRNEIKALQSRIDEEFAIHVTVTGQ